MSKDQENIQLQWIKGDHIGAVEVVKDHVDEYTVFESGRRINTSLINEFMNPVNGEPLDMSPTPIQKVHNIQEKNTQINNKQSNKPESPIKLLLERQEKLDSETLKIDVDIEIPSKDILILILTTFNRDEVLEELRSFIFNQIPREEVDEIIKKYIDKFISLKYSIQI